MSSAATIPQARGPDHTAAFLCEGYHYAPRRFEQMNTDAFTTRIMLRPVTCVRGPEAVEMFYEAGRMTRRGAMPSTVVALLQDKGSVQTLDGHAHRVRKEMFLDMMDAMRLDEARRLFREEWRAAVSGWQGREIVLDEELDVMMTRLAMRWCGIDPATQDVERRATELATMYRAAGKLGPAYLRARVLRRRSERWARHLVRDARAQAKASGVLGTLAGHRDADGALMSEEVAAVELLNVLRPIVAVGARKSFCSRIHRPPWGFWGRGVGPTLRSDST